ncbi:DNA translocase FtsK 4TM domain-containing protein [Patescibacteria group bacterium]|nr:DNA translocase FtsK 4TM domain-containing protein [Patescibacteria group bacterium]
MTKRKNKKTHQSTNLNYLSVGKGGLSSEAKKSLAAIILILLAAVSLISLIQPEGIIGQYLSQGICQLLGWGRWFLPIFLFALAIFIYFRERLQITAIKFIGWGLLFISLQGIFHFFLNKDNWLSDIATGAGGGYVGYGIAWAITKLVGYWSGLIVIIALLIISLIFIFNTNLSSLLGQRSIFNKFIFAPLADGWKYIKNLFSKHPDDSDLSPEEELSTVYMPETNQEKPARPSQLTDTSTINQPSANNKTQPDSQEKTNKGHVNKIDLPLDLLDRQANKPQSGDIVIGAQRIKTTLENFGIPIDIEKITVGPTITQYAIKPAEGIRLEKITSLASNLAMALAAPHPIRIEAPIPGKSLVGIEVPNEVIATVGLREILDSPNFRQRKNNTMIALGKDVTGKIWLEDLTAMPHLLIAGATGSGKSVMLNCIILSLLYENGPEDLRLIMVDPKRVELSVYNGIPHLLTPVVNEASKTINALGWTLNEMSRRLEMFQHYHAKDINSFNEQCPEQKLPRIVFIIDELADLMMMSRKEVEASIIRLAQISRAAGIHLILATQRPSVDIITGVIKGNMPARIAFTVASQVDSRTILDMAGAEKLMGKGDMLFSSPWLTKPVRLQGAFVSENEIKRVIRYIKARSDKPQYINDVVEKHSVPDLPNGGVLNNSIIDSDDDLLEKAKEAVIKSGRASATYLQRILKIGYPRAASLLDQLEELNIIGPVNGAKPREVYISPEEYESYKQMATSSQPLHNPATSQQPSQFIRLDDIWSEDLEESEDKENKEKDEDNNSFNASSDDDQDGMPLNKETLLSDIYSDSDEDNNPQHPAEFDDDEDQEKYFSQ